MQLTFRPARLAAASLLSFLLFALAGTPEPAAANGYTAPVADEPVLTYAPGTGGRETLAIVEVFGNDWYGMPFGDRYDRWRTGHIEFSVLRGERWTGTLPKRAFDLMQYRVRGEIIAPDNLAAPAPGDRLYAPSLWFGATTHFGWSDMEIAAGADLVITGPQTGLKPIHSRIHQFFGNNPINLPAANQIEDGIHLDVHAEIARGIDLSFGELRPFVEVRAGVETLARVGFDITFGDLGENGLRLRDQVTGQRTAGLNGPETLGGWSFLFGADAAWVASSVYLPSDRGPDLEHNRYRVRGGVNFGVGDSNFFYGVTYLSEEFEGQPQGQLLGTLSIDVRF